MKLRSFLTISGVVIAIAAFVSMLSFGAGMQRNVSEQYDKLGLFSTMQVYPPDKGKVADSIGKAAVLDQDAVKRLSGIPGVELAYPFDAFPVTIKIVDTQLTTTAQALPEAAAQTKFFSQMRAGALFSADSSDQAMVSEDLLDILRIKDPDSLVGQRLIVTAKLASLDSGIARVFRGLPAHLVERFRQIRLDSLKYQEYWARLGREEANAALSRFVDGFMNARSIVTDTLRISGVLEGRAHGRSSIKPVIIPAGRAARFRAGGFSDDPTELLASLRSGTLFGSAGEMRGKEYPHVTLSLDPNIAYEPIRDSVKALGFRAFSYAEEFKEIRKFFLYFNLGLSVVGLIALVTASLGIVNTMVMSIIERTREIGVLKSLGAEERDIRLLFLAESGMIGSIGAAIGILFGWLITRVASVVAHTIMAREGIPKFELFALPLWLILTAFLFGLVVSLVAGLYPAARAARVDPVEALRNE
jgi:putative ABC transport system permease protein